MDKNTGSFSAFKSGGDGKKKNDNLDMVHEKVKDSTGQKIGRNDPCPCGAKNQDGTPKKFKKCCGK